MNRKNYSRETLRVLDIIGTYFVDVFYNDIYIKSTEYFANGKSQSCTDAYRMLIDTYVTVLSTQKTMYMTVVKKLHEYYSNIQGAPCIFSDFEDDFLSKFIPKEYYAILNSQEKDKIFYDIIIKSVKHLGEQLLLKENLHRIIDAHKNRSNITLFQEYMVDIFLIQREEYYQKFTKQIVNETTKIPLDVYNKLKAALKEEIIRRTKAEADYAIALDMIKALMDKLRQVSGAASKSSPQGPPAPVAPTVIPPSQPRPLVSEPQFAITPRTPARTQERAATPGAPRKLPQTRYPSPEPVTPSKLQDRSSSSSEEVAPRSHLMDEYVPDEMEPFQREDDDVVPSYQTEFSFKDDWKLDSDSESSEEQTTLLNLEDDDPWTR